MSVVLAAAGGTLPPPVVEVLTRPEVITAMVGVVVAILGSVTAGFVALGRWFGRRLDAVESHARTAAVESTRASEQTNNSHGTNLRDDVDVIRDMVADLATETRQGFRRMDHQFGEVHDRQIQAEKRVQTMDDTSAEEHARIWRALDACPTHRRAEDAR